MEKLLLMVVLGLTLACSGKNIVKPIDVPVVSNISSTNTTEFYEQDEENNAKIGTVIVVNQSPIPQVGEKIGYSFWRKGEMSLGINNQRVLLRDKENFVFWFRFNTLIEHPSPDEIIDRSDIMMFTNSKNRWGYEIRVENILVDPETKIMNIYWKKLHNHFADVYGVVEYYFYFVDKTSYNYVFIEVE